MVHIKNGKRILSLALCLLMLVGMFPVSAFAAAEDGICEHHTEHTADCGYSEGTAEIPCTHICDDSCTAPVTSCVHTHDENCGYAAAVEGAPCSHVCGEECAESCVHTGHTDCGYSEGTAEIPCAHSCTEDSGCIVNPESCPHTHDDGCGYAPAAEASPCTHSCDSCVAEPEVEPVCTCETDDPAIHATNCTAYVAPENPECFCVEKCTEDTLNVWCDVCGTEGAEKCEGEDKGVPMDTTGYTGNVEWSYADGTLTISGSGSMGEYSNKASRPWHDYCNNINTVVIENGVTNIGAHAFSGCVNLVSVTIPASVTSIGNQAFYSCTSLTSVTIPDSVTTISNYAFTSCASLTIVTIEGNVTAIGNSAFSSCSNLTTLNYLGDTAPEVVGSSAIPNNTTVYVPAGSSVTSFAGINTTVDPNLSGPETSTGVITITHDLSNQIVTEGQIIESIFFNATVSNNSELTYQWYQCDDGNKTNARAIEGATSNSYELPKNLTAGQYYFYCTISAEGAESLDTRVATVTVKKAYTITISATPIEGGAVYAKVGSSNVTQAIENTTVTLTVTPAEGYELNTLTVVDADNGTVTVTDNKFTMPGKNVTVTASFKQKVAEHKHAITDCGDELVWIPITELSDITEAGNYYLADDAALTSNSMINVAGTVNLCLNGNSLTGTNYKLTVGADTTLNVCDCVENSTGSIGCTVENNGTLNIYSGAFAIANQDCIVNNATLNVYGGTITNTSGKGIKNTGTLTITGGTITAKGHCIYHEGSNATISGNPTITSTGNYGTIDARGNMTISGGTIQNTGSSYAVGNAGGTSATLTISGGTFTASGFSTVYSRFGTINITAGNFTAPTDNNVLDVNAAVNVSGGTFSSGTSQAIVYMYSNGKCALSGGTFKNGIEVKYTRASGYSAYLPQILADGCAYFQNNAAVTVSSSQSKITGGDATVAAAPMVETYTVTFDANGGTVSTTSATTNLNRKLDSLPTPTRANYDFSGWFDAAEGGNQITTDTVFDADKTVYAHWTPKTYTITYVLNGGTILDNPYVQSYTYGVGAELPDNVTREGYIFRGWADKVTGGTYPIGAVGNLASGNKTYYAYWHAHNWTYTASASTEGGPVDTITATCANTDQMCPNTAGGTVKISANGGTYDGSDHKAKLTVSNDWVGNTLTDADISYEYKQNEADSYAAATDLTKAGYYKASITVDNATAYVEYTVAKKALTITSVTVADRAYEKGEKSVTITAVTHDANTRDEVTVTAEGELSGDTAGTYNKITLTKLTISGKDAGNYSLPTVPMEITVSVTISPKSLTSEDITVSLSDNVIFEGQPTPTVTVKDGDTILTKDTDYTVSQTESGGEFTLTITGTGNYKDAYGSTLTYLEVTLPDPDKVEPYDEDAIDAYNRYTELNKKYQDAELAEKLEELQKALTDYKITKGHKSRYVKTSYKTLTFTANGHVSKFSYIEVDGKQVDAKYYTVASDNGTVITLKTSYLETLSAGKHTIQVFYADGKTDVGSFNVVYAWGSPSTGDDSNIGLWMSLMLMSVVGMGTVLISSKKRKEEK